MDGMIVNQVDYYVRMPSNAGAEPNRQAHPLTG
jgi:hypothetical protein